MSTITNLIKSLCCALPLALGVAVITTTAGCEDDKEAILDVETPETDVELNRSKKDGSLELEIDKDQ